MRTRRRSATALRLLLLAAGAAATARGVARGARALRPVAPDLRTPLVFLPLAARGPRHLAFTRAMMARADLPTAEGPATASVTATVEGREPTRALTHQRPDRARPSAGLVWLHGGGTVLGRPEQASPLVGGWAAELDLVVVNVDYRLAPDHPFPAGLEDAYTALCWFHDHAEELDVDPDRIAVGGDSAGGLLAAALCQVARDRGGPPICFQLLEYPMLDDRTVQRPEPPPGHALVWTTAASRFGWTSYLGGPPRAEDDRLYAAPARTPDLAGLPPAWIGVGDIDLLHDEAVTYAGRLRDAGVPTELHVVPGMYHGADSLRSKAPTSVAFRQEMTNALAAGVGASRPGVR